MCLRAIFETGLHGKLEIEIRNHKHELIFRRSFSVKDPLIRAAPET